MDFLTETVEIENILAEEFRIKSVGKSVRKILKIIKGYSNQNAKFVKSMEKLAKIIVTINDDELKIRFKKNTKAVKKNIKAIEKHLDYIFNEMISIGMGVRGFVGESKLKTFMYDLKDAIKTILPPSAAVLLGNLIGLGVGSIPVAVAVGYLVKKSENRWIDDIDDYIDYHENELVRLNKIAKSIYNTYKKSPEYEKKHLKKFNKHIFGLEKKIRVTKRQLDLLLELALHIKNGYRKYLQGI